jgi:hypothetical protein
VREKYCWLVADKPSEQGGQDQRKRRRSSRTSNCVVLVLVLRIRRVQPCRSSASVAKSKMARSMYKKSCNIQQGRLDNFNGPTLGNQEDKGMLI